MPATFRTKLPRLPGVAAFAALQLLGSEAALALQGPLPDILPSGVLRIALPEDEVAARVEALLRLARSSEPEAVSRVIAALVDPTVRIADAAQRACAAFSTPEAVDALLGPLGLQHPDIAVRVRAADALGRVQARMDAARIAAYLPREGNPECVALLGTLERLGASERLSGDLEATAQALQAWLRGKQPDEARGAALVALAALSPTRAERYAATLLRGRPRPLIYGAAIEAAQRYGLREPNSSLERYLRSRDPRVRANVLNMLDWRGDREAVTWLVDFIQREERLGLAWRAVETLRYRTGQTFGLDVEAWRAHVMALPMEWTSSGVLLVEPRGAAQRITVDELAALEPRSDRLALVVHLGVGQSVEDPAPVASAVRNRRVGAAAERRGSGSPLPVSDALLSQALAQLLEHVCRGAEFDILKTVPELTRLHGTLAPHQLEALPDLVAFATAELRSSRSDLRGDLHGALQAALLEPEVDRVLVLARSGGTEGAREDLELIVDEALATQRFRGIVVDVALIDPSPAYAEALGRLARETKGRLLHVSR